MATGGAHGGKLLLSGALSPHEHSATRHGQRRPRRTRAGCAVLEHPNLITRLSGLAGKPVELIGNLTPNVVSGLVARASQKALMVALRLAMTTLTTKKPLWR